MSDLIERLSRINDPSLYDDLCRSMEEDGDPTLVAARASSLRKARRCWAAVLADMRKPSVAMLSAADEGWRSDLRVEDQREDHARAWVAMIDAYARQHVLEDPPAAATAPPSS